MLRWNLVCQKHIFRPQETVFCVRACLLLPSSVLGTGNELKNFVRKANKYLISRMTNDKREAMKVWCQGVFFWGGDDLIRVVTGREVWAEIWAWTKPKGEERKLPAREGFPWDRGNLASSSQARGSCPRSKGWAGKGQAMWNLREYGKASVFILISMGKFWSV